MPEEGLQKKIEEQIDKLKKLVHSQEIIDYLDKGGLEEVNKTTTKVLKKVFKQYLEEKEPRRSCSSMFGDRNATTDSLFYTILFAFTEAKACKERIKLLSLAKKVYTYKKTRDQDEDRSPKHSQLIKSTIELINLFVSGDTRYKNAYNKLVEKIEQNEKYRDLLHSGEPGNDRIGRELLHFSSKKSSSNGSPSKITRPPEQEDKGGNRVPRQPKRYQ